MSFQPVEIAPSPLPVQNTLRLLPLSDLHLPKPASNIFLRNRAYLDSMDYVVLLGDMVQAYATDKEYGAVRDFVHRLNLPYTAVSGNHEWYFEVFDEDSGLYPQVWAEADLDSKRAQLRKFQQFYGLDSLWRAYDTPLGRFVFLSLDGVETGRQEALSAAQLEFLGAQLEPAQALFVFCHAPLMLDCRLDMVYYEEKRSGCIELEGDLRRRLLEREAPTFWMSGHVHLRPDHYLFPPYRCSGNAWQIHCPDSWGYGRWMREQRVPQHYRALFSRHLEIDETGVTLVTHDHYAQRDMAHFRVDF